MSDAASAAIQAAVVGEEDEDEFETLSSPKDININLNWLL